MNNLSNKAFQAIGGKARLSLNADVGIRIYGLTAREMDPPPPSRKEHRRRGHDFGQVQGMNSQNINPNKAFHRTAHKAPPVNADVGSGIYWQPRAQWTFHHSKTKVTNPAETIWKSEARNSQ